MDDERLKQGQTAFGKDYFRELLERVRPRRRFVLRFLAVCMLVHWCYRRGKSQN